MNSVELIEVIRTILTHRGRGTDDDPHRIIIQYWSKEGELLAEKDHCANHFDIIKERERFYDKILPEICKECKKKSKKG